MTPPPSVHPVKTLHSLHDRLFEFCSQLNDRRPIGVAVSGGSDSLGLLHGLSHVMGSDRIVAFTVDHGLRTGSANEVRRVKSLCRGLGVRHQTLVWDSGPPAAGLQAAARVARYRLIGAAAAHHGLAAVVTAHTLDDQDETLAMRRVRSLSDSAPGLAGISPATLFNGRIWVLRPLLGLRRSDIRDFLTSQGVAWIDDPSNTDGRFERVRVRAMLETEARHRQSSGGNDIAAMRSRLARQAADYVAAYCRMDGNGTVRMSCQPECPPAVLKAVIEGVIDVCGGAARPLDRRGKALLDTVVFEAGSKAVTLGRTVLRRAGADLTIRRERRGLEQLLLGPLASAVWDGRYRVQNLHQNSTLGVSAGCIGTMSPLFSRDWRGTSRMWGLADAVVGGFRADALVGRCSRIQPVHEFVLAQALAQLIGAGPFPECPWAIPGRRGVKQR